MYDSVFVSADKSWRVGESHDFREYSKSKEVLTKLPAKMGKFGLGSFFAKQKTIFRILHTRKKLSRDVVELHYLYSTAPKARLTY